MSETKLCKDCEHYKCWCPNELYAVCTFMTSETEKSLHKRADEVEKSKYIGCKPWSEKVFHYCADIRTSDVFDHCGKEAKYFTPRKSLWQRVKGWFR